MTGRSRARDRSRPSGGAPLWTPSQLAPTAWWRADMGVTLVTSAVAAWADQSGNGAHLVQGTPGLRPTFIASGSRKGQPCIETTSAGQMLTAASITLPREIAIWIVTGTVTTAGFGLAHLVGSTRTHYLYLPGNAAFRVANADESLYFARFSSWICANRDLLGIYDGAAVDVFSNNVNENSVVYGAAFAAMDLTGTVGLFCSPDGVFPSVMQIYEAAIFPAAALASASARQRLRDYSLARYG